MYKESVEVPHTVLRENVKNLVRDSSFNTKLLKHDKTFSRASGGQISQIF